MDQPMDKTQELLQAMATVQIENAVRQRISDNTLHDMAALYNRKGYTLMLMNRNECRDEPSRRALGNAWQPNQFKVRPNTNMLAAIGYAVDEMMATPADEFEPHTVH